MKTGLSVIALFAIVISVEFAAATTNQLVTYRQDEMKQMAEAVKMIALMFDGRLEFDRMGFKRAAEIVRQNSGAALVDLFPSNTLGAPSGAKPNIDDARNEFAEIAQHLNDVSAAITKAADAAPDRIDDTMRMLPGNMAGNSLLGKRKDAPADPDLSKFPAEHLLHLMLQDCTSCHAKFRVKTP